MAFLIASHMAALARHLQFRALIGPWQLALPAGDRDAVGPRCLAGNLPGASANLRIQNVSPLPSRLDLTMQQNSTPQDASTGGEAPAEGVLPSRDQEVYRNNPRTHSLLRRVESQEVV